MSSLRAERAGWQRAVQAMNANGAHPSRVFPDYILVDQEEFRRAEDRFWEPSRPTTSIMYRAHVTAQGQIFCTERLYQWLESVPGQPEVCLTPRPDPPSVPRSDSIRPRAVSAPVQTPPGLPAPGLGTDPSLSSFFLQHPNPLAQHPVKLERCDLQLQEVHSELEEASLQLGATSQLGSTSQLGRLEEVHSQLEGAHFQPKIPQRKSSLYFTSHPASQAQQPSQFGDFFRGLDQTQIGQIEASEGQQARSPGETQENGSVAASQANCESKMENLTLSSKKRHTVQFGSMLDELREHLPIGSPHYDGGGAQSATMATENESEKRPTSVFGSIRKRLSTPAYSDGGRKSSASVVLKDISKSSKAFFEKLTAEKHEEYRIHVAFIGDPHCGKATLLDRYTLGAYTDGTAYQPHESSVRVQLTGPLIVDNFTARADIWDIAHRNVQTGQKHPLSMAKYDVIVICFDIADQRNLESVAKWRLEIQRYCPDIPSILLGLKSDLRPDFPTLRLGFLDESTASTVGQGEEAARKNNASAYYECSANTGEGVTEFFECLARFSVQSIRKQNKLQQKANRRFSDVFHKD